MTFIDFRRLPRENIRIPVKIEYALDNNSPVKVFLGYTFNISKTGIAMHIVPELNLNPNANVKVYIDDQEQINSEELSAKLVWGNKSTCGLQFMSPYESIEEMIAKLTRTDDSHIPKSIQRFYPYVNGNDVDTKLYKLFPYSDKFVTEFRKVMECRNSIKRGRVPDDIANYIFAQYAVADSTLNKSAIESAYRAYQEFGLFSLERRRKILDDIRELLILEKENILKLMIIEGHPRKLAEWEFSGMLTAHLKESLDYYQSQMLQTLGQFGDETLMSVRRPEGVICVSPPKNASCSNSLTASFALLAGNTLVLKPPKDMPISTIYLWRNVVARALKMNGAPKGTINIIMGDSKQFLTEWLESPYVKGILMFNDSEKGLAIGNTMYQMGKKPILELSGNDHMIIWKDAPIEEAADSLLDCFMGSTQICMVPKKAFIHEDIFDSFMKVFIQKVKNLKFGLPSDPETILSPVIKMKDFMDHLKDALEHGAVAHTGGHRVNHLGELNPDGLYAQPTVVEVPIEKAGLLRCMREENFFPLLPVVRVSGGGITKVERNNNIFNDMMNLLQRNQYGLRISIWVRDQYYLKRFIEQVHGSGLLRINARHIGFSPCLSTHGGVGFSGGPFGEMNYVWQKTSHLQGITIRTIREPAAKKLNIIE